MIITLSLTQIMTLSLLSGDAIPFFNRYPMKIFAKHILADSKMNNQIGLYQLGNHRARLGVLTGLPSFHFNHPEDLEKFIKSTDNSFIIMRQSRWKDEFLNFPLTLQATDSGWKKSNKNEIKMSSVFKNGIKPYLSQYSENYVLLRSKSRE